MTATTMLPTAATPPITTAANVNANVTTATTTTTEWKEFKMILDKSKDGLCFASSKQKEVCEKVLKQLSDEELEIAASSSYAYWWMKQQQHHDSMISSYRNTMAMKECQRHYIGEKGNYTKILSAIKEAIGYRLEYDIDSIRRCSSLKTLHHELKEMIIDELGNKQEMVVRGHGKQRHAILYKQPRTVPPEETNERAYIMANLYIAERALAATEYLSCGEEEKLIAIFNFDNYSRSNSPPHHLHSLFTKLLQRTYPERLKKFVVLDAPLWMRLGFKVISPFLAAETREKINFVGGAEKKKQGGSSSLFGELVHPSQATPYLMDGGKLSSEVDARHFVLNVPFYRLYDDDGDDDDCIADDPSSS
eukprot:CAMPEP_0119553550 /NCGR_PEP_ID=MMETSP1352-20130426/6277_1 /TAXON_ID=265584 /ORGANISM="Stauroneis constricta, Strain CCMP1120" /LENGTH=362 /DNA_ID=CAMNT_0007599985 /DNA_START=90 /DNA_END=1178 /DNA_ORIENTATION=+